MNINSFMVHLDLTVTFLEMLINSSVKYRLHLDNCIVLKSSLKHGLNHMVCFKMWLVISFLIILFRELPSPLCSNTQREKKQTLMDCCHCCVVQLLFVDSRVISSTSDRSRGPWLSRQTCIQQLIWRSISLLCVLERPIVFLYRLAAQVPHVIERL